MGASRRSYTDEERELILEDVPSLGINETALKYGVHQSNVSRWAAKAGVKRSDPPRKLAASSSRARGATERTGEISALLVSAPTRDAVRIGRGASVEDHEPHHRGREASLSGVLPGAVRGPPVERTHDSLRVDRAALGDGDATQPAARWRRTVLRQYGGPRLGARAGTSVGSPIFAR